MIKMNRIITRPFVKLQDRVSHVYVIPYTLHEPSKGGPKGHFVVTVTDVCKIGLLGGKVEKGETKVDALCREFLEETGSILVPKYLYEIGTYNVDENGWKTENHIYCYHCDTSRIHIDHDENAGYIRVPITHPAQPRYLSKATGRFFQTFPIPSHVQRWLKDFLILNRLRSHSFFEGLVDRGFT